jgi:hypothetical protein
MMVDEPTIRVTKLKRGQLPQKGDFQWCWIICACMALKHQPIHRPNDCSTMCHATRVIPEFDTWQVSVLENVAAGYNLYQGTSLYTLQTMFQE